MTMKADTIHPYKDVKATLSRESLAIQGELLHDDISAEASLSRESLEAEGALVNEDLIVIASLYGEKITAQGTIVRERHNIEAEISCLEIPDVLIASDGVLYSSEPEPIFTTE